MGKVLVVGGGAAGMIAAIFSARNGQEVHLFEKNEKLGKKIYITGKGRCNLTNACDMEELLDAVVTNKKFLFSSFYGFTNEETMEFFEELGLQMKTERGNRVFPMSDHSSDVIRVLQEELKRLNVKLHLNTKVTWVGEKDGAFSWLKLEDGTTVSGGCVYHCDRRKFIPDDRLHRGWLSFRQRSGAYGDGDPSGACPGRDKGSLRQGITGAFASKCGSFYL